MATELLKYVIVNNRPMFMMGDPVSILLDGKIIWQGRLSVIVEDPITKSTRIEVLGGGYGQIKEFTLPLGAV